MASIKRNFLYSSILTISGYLFPLITFPYVTRVLGVNNIGICNFVDSIIQYFIYFSMMGIYTIGIREIAKAKGTKGDLSKVFSSLLSLNMIMTILSIVILLACTLCIPTLHEYKQMYFIGAAKILSNTLLIEWLFRGLEDFKYITLRSIIVRAIYVLSVLLFVKEEGDYMIYFLLTTMMVLVNAAINILYSRKFVRFQIRNLSFRPYLKSSMILGCYSLLTSMYTTFNVAYLGAVTDTVEVGYYSTATKLTGIILALYSAFTGVMIPRMCSILSQEKYDEFMQLARKSVEVLLAFAIPLIIVSEVCTSQIINIVAGQGYEGAVNPLRITIPLILIIGYEQILVLQVLTPLKKDSAILKNSVIGAVVGITFNIVLVRTFASIGTSVVWFFSEVAVLISAQYFVKKFINFKFPTGSFVKRLLYLVPLTVLSFVIEQSISNQYIALGAVCIFAVAGSLFCELYILHNEILKDSVGKLCQKLHH